MNERSIAELSVPYDPAELSERVARRRRMVRSRLVSLGITLVVLTAIYFWQRKELQGAGFFSVGGVVLGISLAWLVVAAVRYWRSRRQLAGMRAGYAMRIGPPGVEVAEVYAPWPDVASLAVTKARVGRGPALELTTVNGSRARVALDEVTVFPATLDSAVRAFSGSRHGVDLSALDN